MLICEKECDLYAVVIRIKYLESSFIHREGK